MTEQSTPTKSGQGRTIIRAIFWPVLLIVVVAVGYRVWSNPAPSKITPTIALVTADTTAYWDRVLEGADAAADKFDVTLRVIKPEGDLEAQNTALSGAVSQGVDGIAISPVDAARQTAKLRQVAQNTKLVTVDSDSVFSNRVCFVGMDNYAAGRACGEMVQSFLPEGGRVLIATGPLDKANGKARRRGVIDALLGNPSVPEGVPYAVDGVFRGDDYAIVGTLVDPIDPELAAAQIAEYLGANDVDCIVGLYGYHAVAIADAVEQAGKADEIIVVGFDAVSETLDAIAAGRVDGVIAQDQFSYGFDSVRILSEVVRGADYAVPLERRVEFPPSKVTADTLEQFLRDAQRSGP